MANSIDCPQCHRPNDPGARFCMHCGASTTPTVHCPACNQLQAAGTRFCTSCGAAMAGATFHGGLPDGAVVEGVWQRGADEFIRRVDPEDCRTFLGSRVVRIPPGTVGAVVVGGVVQRTLGPGEQTAVSVFERIASFFTSRGSDTAFYLLDLRPIPIPFTIQTRPTAAGRAVQTQVLASFQIPRGDKDAIGTFLTNVLGGRAGYTAGDLYNFLRPEVTRVAALVLERLAGLGEIRYAEAEAEIRDALGEQLARRYGLVVDVGVAPLTTTASLSFHLGTGVAPRARACAGCQEEIPATLRFCDRCGKEQPVLQVPDRRCAECQTGVPDGQKFCNRCGIEYVAPPPSATPLFTADGEQVEVDLVVRVQGQHEDFAPERIAPALVAGVAAHLRAVRMDALGTGEGFAAVEGVLQKDVAADLASFGMTLVSISVVDVRSKTGTWLLGARAELRRAEEELAVQRSWLDQGAREVDLAELTLQQVLRRQEVERGARLRSLAGELADARQEQTLRDDDAFAREQAALDDRRRRQEIAGDAAALDVAQARLDAATTIEVQAAERQVAQSERAMREQDELDDVRHDATKAGAVFDASADLARKGMGLDAEKERQRAELDSERARRLADDAAHAQRVRDEAALAGAAAKARLEQEQADREQARQIDKLRAMAELEQQMSEQEQAHAKQMREMLRGLGEREMIAMQATELARTEGGGAAWAQALAAQQGLAEKDARLADQARHAAEMKDVMGAQLDRMERMTGQLADAATGRQRDAGAAEVYGQSMDAMSRVAASRAQPTPVVATTDVTIGATTDAMVACKQCATPLRPDARFCGACGGQQGA